MGEHFIGGQGPQRTVVPEKKNSKDIPGKLFLLFYDPKNQI
jgi:hypothetical protein